MRACLLFALCASTLFAQSSLGEDEGLALRRIADFWQEGEYQIAKSQMEEFLTQFPESPYSDTLCTALGDLYMREKNYGTALDFYARVQGEAKEKIFLNRMQCLYHLQWHATLADECEQYLAAAESIDPERRLKTTYLLAIALYQQCINVAKDPEALETLAKRARPYFETLAKTELSDEVAQAFAHLCSLLNDHEGAAKIYLDLASKNPESEELLFQAALLQSKYSKQLALETFDTLREKGGNYGKEAAYNSLILHFEQGHYPFIIESKETLLKAVPPERASLVYLLTGKSHLALKQYKEAGLEFTAFLATATEPSAARPALLHLIEAAYQSRDLPLLEQAIARLDPKDEELPIALFSRAQLLKQEGNTAASRDTLSSLLATFPQFSDRPQASFELAHLASTAKDWAESRSRSAAFVEEFPSHELAPFAWRYFAIASSELAAEEKQPETALHKQLCLDLEKLLGLASCLPLNERSDWAFVLAKTRYEIHQFSDALQILVPLVAQEVPFNQKANSLLLLALTYRDGEKDDAKFCAFAEEALLQHQTLIPKAQLHIALFNAYLAREETEAAAEHLLSAFKANAPIQLPNLAWLADYAYSRFEKDPSYAEAAADLLTQFSHRAGLKPNVICADTLYLETFFINLSKLYSYLERHQEAISLLQSLEDQYTALPQLSYNGEKEARLLLAESFLATDQIALAQKQFDTIAALSPTKRNRFSAKAALESARLKRRLPLTKELAAQIAAELKDVIVQKNLENEPLHLEAALDYIELQTALETGEQKTAKKLSLLTKTKNDFESKEDLLSKDYHAARAALEEKNRIYLSYIRYLEAEILLSQADLKQEKELQAKAKDILLQLKNEQHKTPLRERVEAQLRKLSEPQ